ncbi:DUF1573 domain-containing protein [Candidatus Poribacteria bacterium]|nr:DUF1573 domain-containing protein [Candidatus Poribacteria bacterium]
MSKRTILTTIIVPSLLISGLIIFLVNNHQVVSGELMLKQTRLDFGTVPEWKGQVTKSVLIKNIGKRPVNIVKIQTGCVYVDIEGPRMIAAESDATFKVILHPELLPDDVTPATAILYTDSPKTPQVYFTIVATAKRFASLSAEVCDFGEILPETSYGKRVKLYVNEPLNHQDIRLLPSEHPVLTWNIASDEDTDYYILTIQMRATKNDWKQNELISALLSVAFPNDRTLTLPIVGKFVAPLIAKPESLNFGVVNAASTPSLRFTLNSQSLFDVLDIQVPDNIKVVEINDSDKTETVSPYYVRHYKVSWQVPQSPTLLREELHINTSIIPLRIPIYGYIHTNQTDTPNINTR